MATNFRLGKFIGSGKDLGISIDFEPSIIILVAEFNKLGLDIRSFKEPLHRSIKYVMAPSLRKNFDVGGRPPWKPLSELTVRKKASMGFKKPADPLIATGKLRKVMGQINIWEINGIEGYAAITTLKGAEYGLVHQLGREGELIGKLVDGKIVEHDLGGMPARRFMAFQPEDEEAIENIFIKWFQERAMMAGFRPGLTGVIT